MSDFVRIFREIDVDEMEKADENLSREGISMTDALNRFFRIINEYGYFPHNDEDKEFNAETLEAFREADDIMSGRVSARVYDTVDEAFADALKETEDA